MDFRLDSLETEVEGNLNPKPARARANPVKPSGTAYAILQAYRTLQKKHYSHCYAPDKNNTNDLQKPMRLSLNLRIRMPQGFRYRFHVALFRFYKGHTSGYLYLSMQESLLQFTRGTLYKSVRTLVKGLGFRA